MSTYEYQCADCKHTFTLQMTISEHEKRRVECPKCKSRLDTEFPKRMIV